jgi:protein-S-isoprenylcysteine O-methyltransferase Ste14
MTSVSSSSLGKFLYGALFVLLVPAGLVVWAHATENVVTLPRLASAGWGIAIGGAGSILMLAGIGTLMRHGNGLPMNAYPPSRFVAVGIYRILAHPIYVGFSALSIGAAIFFGSASGFWLVSPVVILGCAALVWGFERPDLDDRFGSDRPRPLLKLPSQADRPATVGERISVYLLVLLPWVLLYEAVAAMGIPNDAMDLSTPLDRAIPVWEWTELLYALTYIFVASVPILASSSRTLREFSIGGLSATAVGMLLFITLPIVAGPRVYEPQGPLGRLLAWERIHDTPACAFPSFHVAWVLLCASALTRSHRRGSGLWWILAVLISISCLTTGQHTIADVLGGAALGWFGIHAASVWEAIRSRAERIANSWKEWHAGGVRIINHGVYAGIGTFLGLTIVGTFAGREVFAEALVVAFSGLICSALWAQFIEGSPSLLRPYGYYGGVLGVILGVVIMEIMFGNGWPLLAAFATAGPVIQAMGRIRCLVQGCCHGSVASAVIGIRYTHPRSRVTRLSKLGGLPVHPTPVYSILVNIVLCFLLFRLWSVRAELPLICGLYLMLNSIGRFVEEAYRGEPQTPVLGKLRLYQVVSIAGMIGGVILTCLHSSAAMPSPRLDGGVIGGALLFGMVTCFALGVDFPGSNRRFARLV